MSKLLIIDRSRRTMKVLQRFLNLEVDDLAVELYDAGRLGKPDEFFAWEDFQAVLIAHELGDSDTGLEWFKDFARQEAFPPAILITGDPTGAVTTDAMKAGFVSALNKRDLTPKGLANAVEETLKASRAQASTGLKDEEIVARSLGTGTRGQDCGYRFTRLIGQGAMSRVYLAERVEDDATVVLKILDGTLSADDEGVQRFIREAEMVSGIDSPYVVKIFEQGFTNNYGFIAMEFFSRGDLAQRIETTNISIEDAVIYTMHIACGLREIHSAGIVHRDLKPANIMFRGDESLALADFGISKKLDNTMQLTRVGSLMGTPYYMSPEQALGKRVDVRADLYAVGVMLYEMITGDRPFVSDTLSGIIYQHINSPVPDLPADASHLQRIFERMLAKDVESRYQHAEAIIEDLSLAMAA
ncbi:MAG: protein kinase [Pseudomonadota bacterium]